MQMMIHQQEVILNEESFSREKVMSTFFIIVSKYLFILLMLYYTWESFNALKYHTDSVRAAGIFQRQNAVIFATYLLGIINVFINEPDELQIKVILLGGIQFCYLIVVLGIFPIIYPNINRAILSNMCMLLTIGFIVLARLNMEKSITQFIIVAVVSILSLIVPFLMSKYEMWQRLTWLYLGVGLGLLVLVLVLGSTVFGANLSIEIAGFTFQPSEFVKIIYVFFVASILTKSTSFKNLVISACLAAAHVLVLVMSTDLGSALIFFMIYVFMLYVGTKQVRYVFIGFGGISVACILAYYMFGHVQTRVAAWLDPWTIINDGGYQITQSLFALGNGGLTGTGLYQGAPYYIPVVEKDMVFAAIGEEFGAIFSMLLILVFFCCFVGFLITAMEQINIFNKLVCVGLGVGFAVQVILTIGGALKMIPLTGVTLPLISYGGSSILSILIVFAIIQGMAIVGTQKPKSVRRKRTIEGASNERGKSGERIAISQTQEIKIPRAKKTK